MAEHNIENFMKLVESDKGAPNEESRSNQYYREIYEKLNTAKKISWNWAALLGGCTWLIYRKMYLMTILFPILVITYYTSLGLLLIIPFGKTFVAYDFLFLITLVPILLVPNCLLACFGNWLYIRHIHKKIDKGYHLCKLKNTDGMSALLSVFFPFLVVISGLITVVNDKRKVKRALSSLS